MTDILLTNQRISKSSHIWEKMPTKIRSLVVRPSVQTQLAELAAIPGESCGVIIGHAYGDRLVVTSVYYWNTVGEDKSFCLPISFIFDAINEYREKGGQDSLLGIFHTHPGGETALSEVDLAYANLYNWIWLIASSIPDDTLFAAYACIKQKVSVIPVELETS